MSNDAKKTSELAISTTLSANDRVVILKDPDSSPSTKTITATNFANSVLDVMRYASSSLAGVVKIDNSSIVISNGVISSATYNFAATSSNIIPAANNTYSLGNSSMQWKSLYVSNDTIYISGTPLTINDNGVLLVNNVPISTNTGAITFANATLSTNTGDVTIQAPTGNVNIISQGSQFTFDNHIGRFIMPAGGDITSETGNFTISNAEYISFNNNDMYVGEGMGPWVIANNSISLFSTYSTNNTSGYQGSLSYPGTYQFFINEYFPNSSISYAVTLRDDGTLTSDATVISNKDVVAVGNTYTNNLIVNNNIYFSGNIYDELKRPIYNPNALDINTDGGTSLAVFSKTDPAFDGGAGETLFALYEAALDGGVSFNNRHSASYIDGGGANQL